MKEHVDHAGNPIVQGAYRNINNHKRFFVEDVDGELVLREPNGRESVSTLKDHAKYLQPINKIETNKIKNIDVGDVSFNSDIKITLLKSYAMVQEGDFFCNHAEGAYIAENVSTQNVSCRGKYGIRNLLPENIKNVMLMRNNGMGLEILAGENIYNKIKE